MVTPAPPACGLGVGAHEAVLREFRANVSPVLVVTFEMRLAMISFRLGAKRLYRRNLV
jgi:hypothetical protein